MENNHRSDFRHRLNKIQGPGISALSLTWFLITSIILSCNNNDSQSSGINKTADTSKSETAKAILPNVFCYSTVGSKDTVFLKTEISANVVQGSLLYKLFEKDINKGTIEGLMTGDTLLADYTFMSEGKPSVRQVAFVIKDGLATEGYGDMEEKDGKLIFKNVHSLDFTHGIRLQKVGCAVN